MVNVKHSAPGDTLRVRRFWESDIPYCTDIVEKTALFEGYGLRGERIPRTLLGGLTDPDSDLWTVVSRQGSERIQGFAWVTKRAGLGRSAYLRLICVAEEARGHGVGELLVHHIEKTIAAKKGLLLVCTHTNAAAQAFYERLGYVKVGMIPEFAAKGHDEMVYWKPNETTD